MQCFRYENKLVKHTWIYYHQLRPHEVARVSATISVTFREAVVYTHNIIFICTRFTCFRNSLNFVYKPTFL